MKLHSFLFAIVTAICLFAAGALADVPTQINFQGTLTDSSGNPITGSRFMRFYLYADSTGGSPLWMDSQGSVDVSDGLFHVTLGSNTPLPDSLFDGSVLWLAIRVNPDLVPMEPRQPLITTPYSFRSIDADHSTSSDSALYAIHADTAAVALSGGGLALPFADSVSSSGSAFSVTNTGYGTAIYGEQSGLGNSGYLGGCYGAYGEYGNGNKGYMGSSSYGVYGFHQSAGNWGDLGDIDYGVYGRHTSGNEGYIGSDQFGAYGKNDGSANWGYLGGGSLGAYGKHMSSSNYGQLGSSNYGAYGYGSDTDRKGVQGNHSTGNYGYLGGDSVGVYGYGNGYAGYFEGDVCLDGNVYAGARIGIGTETPETELHVEGTITVDQTIQADDSGGLDFTNDDGFIRLKIEDNGNVGIGTTSPDAKLDVNGSVKLGSNGSTFLEVKEVTGNTTPLGDYSNVSYPAGYSCNNVRVLSLEVEIYDQWWLSIGHNVIGYTLTFTLRNSYIRINHGPGLNDRSYRFVLMKM